jgi:hypothetical protein
MQTIYVKESIDYELVAEAVGDEELRQIRELEEAPLLRADDLAMYNVTLVTDRANGNKRLYTREWQARYAEQFTGMPVTTFHSDKRVGGILRSWTEDGRTRGRLYVLRSAPGAPEAIATLEARTGGLSIEAYVVGQQGPDGVVRVVPGPYTQARAVSIVPNPADAACVAAREAAPEGPPDAIRSPLASASTAPGALAPGNPAQPVCEAAATDPLAIFAKEALRELADEAVRYAGLTLGTGGVATYRKVAESLDPLALREWVATLKRAYAEAHKPDVEHLKAIEATANAELQEASADKPAFERALETARQIGRLK